MNKFIILLLLAFLVSCTEQVDNNIPTPAQGQIEEYTNRLKMCAAKKDSDKANNNQSVAVTSNDITIATGTENLSSSNKSPDFPNSGASDPEGASQAVAAIEQLGGNQISAFQEDDIIFGNQNSKIVIVEYFALTCPHCAYFHRNIYPDLKKKYIDTNIIAFVQREFVGTRQDLEASVLVRCAGKTQRLKFYDVLLQQQDNWAFNRNYHEVLTNIGQLGGISPEKFAQCLSDTKILELLQNNSQTIARTPGFTGTPAFIINDKLYNGAFSLEGLSSYIEQLRKNLK